MGIRNRSNSTSGDGGHRLIPRWTLWEILGLVVSAALVAAPLFSLAYAFLFPIQAPAAELAPTPTTSETETPTPEPGTPTAPPPTLPPTTGVVPPTTAPTTPIVPPTTAPTTPVVPPTTAPTTPIPTSPPTSPGCGDLTVEKAADRDSANPGETVVFSIGLTNQTCSDVVVTLNDTLPAQMALANVWHTCAAGNISPGGNGFSASLTVRVGQACQVIASATVSQGCDCYVRNETSWNGGGYSGTARSQQIWLPLGAVPTTLPATAGPTNPPTAVPTTVATSIPTPGSTSVPTIVPTPVPTGAATPVPTIPPATPVPTGVPTAVPTPVPTAETTPGIPPTRRPTERRPRSTPEPTSGPVPPCAQARVAGNVCASGVTVTISSCCPAWSAKTTSNASGFFEFGGLTPGAFTVSARGISRAVRLNKCDSVVNVTLCPTTPGPTKPATPEPPVTAGPTLTTTVPAGTRLPTAGDITLRLEALGADDNFYLPGEGVALQLTLHNGHLTETLQGVIIGSTLDKEMDLLGASSRRGEIRLSGQDFLLTGASLAPRQDLIVHLDAAMHADTASGTVILLHATARTITGDMIESNELRLEVWGEGMAPQPAGGTPLGAVTPIGGGPEPQPTNAAVPPSAQPPILPPTSTGMPVVGILLGGGVLLARQLRLRRTGRRNPE